MGAGGGHIAKGASVKFYLHAGLQPMEDSGEITLLGTPWAGDLPSALSDSSIHFEQYLEIGVN